MIVLRHIKPEDLTDDDIGWLVKGSKESFDGTTAISQVRAAQDGQSCVYRITGDATGVVVLSVGGDRLLTITCLAGSGLLKHFNEVHEAILSTAAAAGASRVNGFTLRAGLQALFQRRTKAKLVPMFVEEVL